MNEYLIVAFIAGVAITVFLTRRKQEPHRLSEVSRGLKYISETSEARGNNYRAKDFREMAQAIVQAQGIVATGTHPPVKELDLISVRLKQASGELGEIGGLDQNHRHECYKAILNLAEKIDKIATSYR